jgi:hypothetical protein
MAAVVRALCALLLPLLGAAPAAAQEAGSEVPAAECCLKLLMPIGARALSLGQALTARSGAEALFLNPAALADGLRSQFVVHSASTALERTNAFTLLLDSELLGSFALSYHLADYGDQEATDIFGIPTGLVSRIDHVLAASYATDIIGGLAGGVSIKLFQQRHECKGFCNMQTFSATTYGIDVGAQYQPAPLPALRVGMSLLHAGFPLQVINAEQASPLPTRIRAGAAYEALHHFRQDSTVSLWLSADVARPLRSVEGDALVYVGAELGWERLVFARAGYAGGSGITGGPAIGLGLRYDRFEMSVARSFVTSPISDQEPFQVSFGVRF